MIKRWMIKLRRSNLVIRILKILFYIAGMLPVKRNTIIFESFYGKQFNDNPKVLYEYIKEHYPNYKLYWSFDRRHKHLFQEDNINALSRFSLRWILVKGRAKYWITNSRLPLWIPKPKHTVYLQTWHGTPLKKLGADIEEVQMPGTTTDKYIRNFLFEAGKWDYLVSPNAYSSAIFKRAFGFAGTMIESGYPRNDALYNRNNQIEITKIKRELNIDPDKKVILYAPTWRDNQYYSTGKYKLDLQLDLDKMQAALGEDYVILLRMHYLMYEALDFKAYQHFVKDVSTYPEVSDLFLAADMLITDYSSVFFDYANLKRPMIFFAYDIEEYRDQIRGFYFDFEQEAPGPVVKTTDEVIEAIIAHDPEKEEENASLESFYSRFCYLDDGNASKRVVEQILPGEAK